MSPPYFPHTVNLDVYQGDTSGYVFELTYKGTPVDLTGWINWQATWQGPTASGTWKVTVDAERGLVHVTIPSDPLARQTSGCWDLQAETAGGGTIRTFVRGVITVHQEAHPLY